MDGTTAIKIDYYEELKRKADFVDKMISPSANEIYKEFEELKAKANELERRNNGIDVIDNCICDYCSSTVKKDFFYCPDCGTGLIWDED